MSTPSFDMSPSTLPQQHIFSISCTTCRQRKIKCTRSHPCVPCQQAGYDCDFPQRQRPLRKKRGKSVQQAKVAQLADRLKSVEALISQMRNGSGKRDNSADGIQNKGMQGWAQQKDAGHWASGDGNLEKYTNGAHTPEAVEKDVKRYAECPFWQTLCDQIGNLQQLLVEPELYDTDPDPPLNQQSRKSASGFLFVPSKLPTASHYELPPSDQITILTGNFVTNVDPMVKILHLPSLRSLISSRPLDYVRHTKREGTDALLSAVFFAAVTSMTEVECQTQLEESRVNILARFRCDVEDNLRRADFMYSVDMATLQALVLFLSCLRSTDESKAPWTLVSLAVRLGHMLHLHRDGAGSQYTPFEAEMRRRLWWQIIMLDIRASEDWGSDSIVLEQAFNTEAPNNINDDDMDLHAETRFASREGFTQMTFCLLCHEANTIVKLFNTSPRDPKVRPLRERQQLVVNCQERIVKKCLQHCNSSDPLAWATHAVGRLIIFKAWLLVHYPMSPQDWTALETSVNRQQLLLTSVMILELSYQLETNEAVMHWWWLFKTYVQWHALAVTLAELCVQAHTPLLDRAWNIIDAVYELWSGRVAGTKAGIVWLPIKKLYAKAQQVRLASVTSSLSLLHDGSTGTLEQSSGSGSGSGSSNLLSSRRGGYSSVASPARPYEHMASSTLAAAFNPAGPDLPNTNTFCMESWNFDPLLYHDDAIPSSNWDNWDEFVHDTGDSSELDLMALG